MRILLDVNVLLDVVLNRPEFVDDSRRFLNEANDRAVTVFMTSISVTTAFYLARKLADDVAAFAVVDYILSKCEIIAVDTSILTAARGYPGRDFEDNVQAASAIKVGVGSVVTRDAKGFKHSGLRVLSPAEATQALQQSS